MWSPEPLCRKLRLHVGIAVGAIAIAGIAMAPARVVLAEVAPFGMAERKPKPLPEAESATAAVADTGVTDSPLYSVHCIACHGADAQGVEGLGVSLVNSELVAGSAPDELVAFLKKGRLPTDPDSVTGIPMPSFSWMAEEDLSAIVADVQDRAQ